MVWILIMFSMPMWERTAPAMYSVEFNDEAACQTAMESRIRFIRRVDRRSYESGRIDFECVPKTTPKNKQQSPANRG
jgi:hypothetical protein